MTVKELVRLWQYVQEGKMLVRIWIDRTITQGVATDSITIYLATTFPDTSPEVGPCWGYVEYTSTGRVLIEDPSTYPRLTRGTFEGDKNYMPDYMPDYIPLNFVSEIRSWLKNRCSWLTDPRQFAAYRTTTTKGLNFTRTEAVGNYGPLIQSHYATLLILLLQLHDDSRVSYDTRLLETVFNQLSAYRTLMQEKLEAFQD